MANKHLTPAELAEALRIAADYFKWHRDSIEDFHKYAYRFGATPGTDVYTFLLRDALKSRGLTLEQFRVTCSSG